MKINTILLPTDFSETANHAEDQAAVMAQRHGARLELFHVVEPYGEPPPNMMATVRKYIENLEQEAETTLNAKATAIRARGVEVSYSRAHHTPPFDAITTKIASSRPDLVVIGTHGRRGFQHLVLGSVAERLLRSVTVNVLSLHVNAPPVGGDRNVTSILVPIDFSDCSSRALDTALSLLARDGTLHVVHVVHKPAYPSVYPTPFPPDEPETFLTSGIQTQLNTWLGDRAAQSMVRIGDPGHQVLEAQADTGAELIVMGTRGLSGLSHALLGSVTERVVRRSPVAVLTVH